MRGLLDGEVVGDGESGDGADGMGSADEHVDEDEIAVCRPPDMASSASGCGDGGKREDADD